MLFDWFAREGWIIVNWWLLVTLAGVAVFPLCTRLLSGLPDKGYTLARAVGLLLVGFVFWLLASLGFLRNMPGSVVLAWLIVLVISLWVYARGERFDWRAWWDENKRVVVVAEVLFIVLLVGWTIVRAHQNSLTSTEKPMDLAFMSASQRSEVFPPNDPWMSGYAISYYYFGYSLAGMLSMMSGIHSSVGFNMTISLWFALTGLTTFGVVYNLVRSRVQRKIAHVSHTPALLTGLLAMVFVVLMGNLQVALVEAPGSAQVVSEDYMRFWGTQARLTYPPVPATTDPTHWDSWWWFRASRVLNDFQLNGEVQPDWYAQPIDEFPQFSFLLADNHPHVLALPFAVLALGLALNVLLKGRSPARGEIVFYGICLGGLIFLNTWDGPIYIVILLGAEALRRIMHTRTNRLRLSDIVDLGLIGLGLVGVAIVAYLPWFVSFRSQAAGLLPNLTSPTLFRQYFIMFGPFLLILAGFVIVEAVRARRDGRMNWSFGLQITLGTVALLALALVVLIAVASLILYQQTVQAQQAGLSAPPITDSVLRFVEDNGGWGSVLPALLRRRLEYGLTTVVLLVGIALVVGRLFPRIVREKPHDDPQPAAYSPATGFALLLLGAGLMLSLIPEFVYLRDNFGTRINTIFKFYYQVWVLFSVASAYGVYTLFADHDQWLPVGWLRGALAALFGVAILAGILYPVLGIHNRMFIENGRSRAETPPPLTLDGGPSMIDSDDYAVIMCLNDLVEGSDAIVAEAIGNPYNPAFGRVGALTGIPVVLGWENHERQWRGSTFNEVAGTRAQDMAELFTDLRWDIAERIIDNYGIDYILYGASERSKYGMAGEEKFIQNLESVCSSGQSRIYRTGA